MSESRRNTPAPGRKRGAARGASAEEKGSAMSVVRTALAALLVLAGIVWIVVFMTVADSETLPWMADLGRWNFLIGFSAIFLGLAVSANPGTPLGRGRGVVIGMLGSFLIGLVWIIVYYMAGDAAIPLISDLAQYNLLVGVGFMGVGFVFATHWE